MRRPAAGRKLAPPCRRRSAHKPRYSYRPLRDRPGSSTRVRLFPVELIVGRQGTPPGLDPLQRLVPATLQLGGPLTLERGFKSRRVNLVAFLQAEPLDDRFGKAYRQTVAPATHLHLHDDLRISIR